MSIRRSSLRNFLPSALLALSSLLWRPAQAEDQPQGRKPEVSDPRGDEAATRVNQLGELTSRKGKMRDLNDDLVKPWMQMFSPKSSLDGVMMPPVRPARGPVIPSKKVESFWP